MRRISPRPFRILVSFAALAIAAAYLSWGWSSELGDFGGDNAIYMLTAQYFAPYAPSTDAVRYFATHSQYPPLYPFALALFGGAQNILIAHLVTTLFLLGAFWVLFLWCRAKDLPEFLAFMLIAMFGLSPGTYIQTLSLHSENLYLLLSLATLLACAYANKTSSAGWYWTAAFLAAATALTRSAGITLVLAFSIYVLLRRVRFRVLLSLSALAPIILWSLLNNQQGPRYLDSFFHIYGPHPLATLLAQLRTESYALWAGWIANFTMGGHNHLVAASFGIICLLGMAWRAVRLKLDGVYIAAYLLVILVWPYPSEAERFMFAVLPVLAVEGILLLYRLPLRTPLRSALSVTVVAVLLLVMSPDLALNGRLFLQPVPDDLRSLKQTYLWYASGIEDRTRGLAYQRASIDSLRSLKNLIPPNQCVFAVKPSLVGYYANRIAKGPPPSGLDSEQFNSELKKDNCQYLYLFPFPTPSYPMAFYPAPRLKDRYTVSRIFRVHHEGASAVAGVLARLRPSQNNADVNTGSSSTPTRQ